jgi:uncharacterized protein YukE
VTDSSARIRGAWSSLQSEWSTAREHWRDAMGEQFERSVWQSWEQEVPQLIKVLEELDEVLDQAISRT